ncbi:MAG TPA: cytochrome c maturation protein CcmE [Kofleriaceae bacterium]
MRVALIVVVACIACGGHDDRPPKIKRVDRLDERDRGELVQIAGRASAIRARTGSGAPHLRFELALAGRSITVVTKDYVPDLFRDGVDVEVTGRWVHTADVRAALDKEGFQDVRGEDVLLAREVRLAPLSFQF